LNKTSGHSDVKLYFVDEKPDPMSISTDTKEVMAAIHSPSLSSGAADQSKSTAKVHNSPSQTSSGNAEGFNTTVTKVNAAKNLQMLLELHCAHDHWNFEDVATHYGLTLPNPRPECWACLLAKPRRITHDKVSTRQCTRASEGFSADAKGPFDTPTPEGYLYFFLIVCLYSHYYWAVLAESQADWETIWPIFVKREEVWQRAMCLISYHRRPQSSLTEIHEELQ
jgi:hypothetical protein